MAIAIDPPTIKGRCDLKEPHLGKAFHDLTILSVTPGLYAFPGNPCSLGSAEGLLGGGRAEAGSETGSGCLRSLPGQTHGVFSEKQCHPEASSSTDIGKDPASFLMFLQGWQVKFRPPPCLFFF